jgi:hypothetical protein
MKNPDVGAVVCSASYVIVALASTARTERDAAPETPFVGDLANKSASGLPVFTISNSLLEPATVMVL